MFYWCLQIGLTCFRTLTILSQYHDVTGIVARFLKNVEQIQVQAHITKSHWRHKFYPSQHLMLKVNNRNTRARCEICSNLTIDTRTTPLASLWYIYCQLSTYFTPCSSFSIVIFEHVIAGWDCNIILSLLCDILGGHLIFFIETNSE